MNEFLRIKDVSLLITKGTTPSSVGHEFLNSGISFVKSESISGSKYLDNKIFAFIDETTDHILKRSRLRENDLLYSIAGAYLGKTAIVRAADLPANTNQAVAIIRLDKNKCLPDYLYYFLKQKHIVNYVNGLSAQSSQPNLNLDLLGKLPFLWRPIKEQKKIAAVLSSLDAKIELNQRMNAELEAMAKTLYDYWFVQFNFPYDFSRGEPSKKGKPYKSNGGKMVWNGELKREVPDGWEVGTINDFGEIITGGTPSTLEDDNFCQNGIAWITPKDLSDTENKYIKKGGTDISKKGLKTSSAKLMPAGSVLLTTRAPIGYLAIAKNEVTTNQGFKSIVPKPEFGSEYVYYTINSIVPKLQILGVGSTFREISKEVFSKVPVALPPSKIIQEFKNIINPVAQRKMQSEDEIHELTSLRDWLLPLLMNGQVRVKGARVYEMMEEELGMVAEE